MNKLNNYYVAENGQIFDNAENCQQCNIDFQFKHFENWLIFFDIEGHRLPCSFDFSIYDRTLRNDSWYNAFQKSQFIYIGNSQGVSLAKTINDEYGCGLPEEVGYWSYNCYTDSWDSITETMESLKKILSKLQKFPIIRSKN